MVAYIPWMFVRKKYVSYWFEPSCAWPGMYNLYLFTFYIEDYKSIPYLENIFYKSRIFIKSKIELKKKYGQLKMGCHLFEQGKISHEKETYFENFIKKGQ